MKKSLIISFLLLSITLNGFAQHQSAKVIAVLNKASWCHICQANDPRFEKDIMPMVMNNKDVQMIMNDLSNDKTKASSKTILEKAGIGKFAQEKTATGMLYFLNAKSKKVISEISVAATSNEIKQAFMSALSKG